MLSKILRIFGIALVASIVMPGGSIKTHARSSDYSVSMSVDKSEVKAADPFKIAISVTNNSDSTIKNLELRIPFYKNILDATNTDVSPSFNKLVDTGDFPAGFNNRSWIINSFDPGETKNYSVSYTVVADPAVPNGLVAGFTLPTTWKDPRGLQGGSQITMKTFRADVYIDGSYKSSFDQSLPKLNALDTPVSIVKLNDKYLFAGSKTTSLKTVTTQNITAFPNFTLETADVLIEWIEPIDFSGTDVVGKLAKLDQSIVPTWGKLTVAQDMGFLTKKAKVTFKNMVFVSEPRIKVKGQPMSLIDGRATWNKSLSTVTVNLDAFSSTSVMPSLELDQAIIETNSASTSLKGKVSDPATKVTYKIDDKTSVNEVLGIDLQTGAFSITLDNLPSIKQVEVSTKYKNDETTSKVVLVKYNKDGATATPTATAGDEGEKKSEISLLNNPITLALVAAALAIMAIIGSYIYYLYSRKRRNEKKEDLELEPVIESVSTIGQRNETHSNDPLDPSRYKIPDPNEVTLDLPDGTVVDPHNALRRRELDVENIDKKPDSNADGEKFTNE